ncbi:MAG: GTP-binding protein, partial [Candidatus Saccharibacteria bacterium]|nr:GTP-binding protein [Candidatus Saccharibacteria bacterium]
NGALGSGKTTFINCLLKQPSLAGARVIENEFANIGIDASQLDVADNQIITIAGACICCSTGTELVDALNQFADDSAKPVIIEATGTADSVQLIEKVVTSGALDKYDVAASYYILDAAELAAGSIQEGIDKHLAELKLADIVLISKTDLISDLQLKRLQMSLWYAGLNNVYIVHKGVPEADEFVLEASQIVNKVYGVKESMTCSCHHDHDHSSHKHNHETELQYLVIDVADARIDSDKLKQQWPSLAANYGLLRLKGDFIDANGDQYHVEATPTQIVTGLSPLNSAPLKLVLIGSNAASIPITDLV